MRYPKALLSIPHRVAAAGKRHSYLLILLVVAFGFRISGVFWGLPPFDLNVYHPDEPKIINGAFRFPRDITQRQDLRYPTACHYTLGALAWPIKKCLQLNGHDSYTFVYMAGRLLSTTLGTATVLLVYLFARRSYDRTHAIVAASAIGFSMLHVTNSAWATPDVATSFLLALFLLLLISTIERQSSWLAVSTGVTLGMLVGAKYTGIVAVMPLFVLVLAHEMTQQQSSLWRRFIRLCTHKVVWIVGLSSLFVFLLTTPGILLHPEAFASSIQYERTRMAQTRLPLYEVKVWSNVFAILVRTMGLPLTLYACLGLCISCINHKKFEIALASLVIVFLVYFGNSLAPRYVIMIMPVLAIFAARALLFFFSAKSFWVRVGSLAICFGVLLHAFWYSAAAVLSRYPDTRTTAAQYIREEIPPGSTIGIAYTSVKYVYPHHCWRYPRIDFSVLRYVDFLESPEWLVVTSYDADKIVRTFQSDLLEEDFTFPASLAYQWYQKSPPSPEIFAFFHNLYFSDQTEYELLKKFIPRRILAPIEFPPPTIEIYRQRQNEP